MNAKPTDTMIYVDLTEMLKEQPQEQEQQQQAKDEDYRSLRNKVSDVNGGDQSVGKMIERAQADGQRAAQNGKMDLDQDLSDEAEAVAGRLSASRAAFEKGRREEQEMIDRNKAQREARAGEKSHGVKQQGSVLVEYNLPGRRDVSLFIPAYQCEGSGRVVVAITVNRNGKVTAASVKESSVNSTCLSDAAVQAARNSRFNVDPSVSDRQMGTISYRFVPQ